MATALLIQGVFSIIFGVLVIIFPRFLNILVGAYFILIGLVMIFA